LRIFQGRERPRVILPPEVLCKGIGTKEVFTANVTILMYGILVLLQVLCVVEPAVAESAHWMLGQMQIKLFLAVDRQL